MNACYSVSQNSWMVTDAVQDVIYVKTEGYSASNNQLIAYDPETQPSFPG